ncbi:MAG: hypothetical protein L6R37_007796 [Teloschistes peruensis]|nr:MAG: hypothetical protein L6R37_007796 [Teloschistes peruensis]
MQFSTLFLMAAAFMVGSNALNILREAGPEPAGCKGEAIRDMDEATAAALCAAECPLNGCMKPFLSGDYYYAVCICN